MNKKELDEYAKVLMLSVTRGIMSREFALDLILNVQLKYGTSVLINIAKSEFIIKEVL